MSGQSHICNLEDNKKDDSQSSHVSNKGLRMMNIMGYNIGAGLGKNEQGIITSTSLQFKTILGTRGFGFETKNLERTNEEWDFSLESIDVQEKVEWLFNLENFKFTFEDMIGWTQQGEPLTTTENEHNFCDKDVLTNVLQQKTIFDELDEKELRQARGRANPFEKIRNVFFMNRAALKMANIDAATDFMFTKIDQDTYHINNTEPYYFADVCAGPGGFTEYILWRKKWWFKGFGLTLRDSHDFKLTDSVYISPATFFPLYGKTGDGNVCCPENIDDFKEKVMHETDNRGVHFMMSDGGFSVEGQENLQEVLSKNIYVCQCLVALEILREHGCFVTKLFDVFTKFSVGLLFLMYNCFEKVSILKPNSSRPANSERYFICSNFKNNKCVQEIRSYLRSIVNMLWELKDNKEVDILEIVPLHIIKNDNKFFSYISSSNNRLAKRQTVHLKKLAAFCRNPLLVDNRQEELRRDCLKYWQIPDELKLSLPKLSHADLLKSCVNAEFFLSQPEELNNLGDLSENNDLKDWHYIPLQSSKDTDKCYIFASLGKNKVHRLEGNSWVKVRNLYLPRGTVLYGELVVETVILKNPESKPKMFKQSLHVIDALRLGDTNLNNLKFQERRDLINVFCKAVNYEFKEYFKRVRPKFTEPIEILFNDNKLKKSSFSENYTISLPVLGYNAKEEFLEVNSLLLMTEMPQSFCSTLYFRRQIFISQGENLKVLQASVNKILTEKTL